MEEFAAVRPVETLQPPYHLFQREIEEEILPYARAHDIGVLAYSPLASGLLAGRIDEDTTFEADDWRSQASAFTGEALRAQPRAWCAGWTRWRASSASPSASSRSRGCWPSPACTSPSSAHAAPPTSRRAPRPPTSSSSADDLAHIEEIAADAVQIEGATPEGVLWTARDGTRPSRAMRGAPRYRSSGCGTGRVGSAGSAPAPHALRQRLRWWLERDVLPARGARRRRGR